MNLFRVPVDRPVATSMFFIAVAILGWIGWSRIPVELFPPVTGNELYVNFVRPGSEPAVIEREILLPLEARVSELEDVDETWATVGEANSFLTVRFDRGTDLGIRELELRRVVSEIVRDQPAGTFIDVQSQDLRGFNRFVMFVQVTGFDDRNRLLDLVQEEIEPRLLSVPGVSSVRAGGGRAREVTVEIDSDRCAAMGVRPDQVTAALTRTVRRLDYLGGIEDGDSRLSVILDGRPRGLQALGDTRVSQTSPVLLRHVADIDYGVGREEIRFHVNGQPTVGLAIFQDQGANLIALGRALRSRLSEIEREFEAYGLDFVINIDSAELVEDQLDRLQGLALSGFVIALVVLFLYLRQWRAVAVVAVAVPASLLAALALLYLGGYSINVITLFGLAVGIGMLVDNSIVVYEAVQRQLERGVDADDAAEHGVRRTLRAILASSATNAIVFLPVAFADFDNAILGELLLILAVAIILPLIGSTLVAVGLVPLLARRLAARAALDSIRTERMRREVQAGLAAPDRTRELFGAMLKVALRRPGGWIVGVTVSVLITVVVSTFWLATGAAPEPPEAREVRFNVTIDTPGSVDAAAMRFERLESAALDLEGIDRVDSFIQEESGQLTVHLPPADERPPGLDAARVRAVLRQAAQEAGELQLATADAGFGGGGGGDGGGGEGDGSVMGALGGGPSRVVLSGPDSVQLAALANAVRERLDSIEEVGTVTTNQADGRPELRVTPIEEAMRAFGVTPDQVLPALNIVRREGVEMRTGFTLEDGKEITLAVRRAETGLPGQRDLQELRLATPIGPVALGALSRVRRMPATPQILHRDGRREVSVSYRLAPEAPQSGPSRQQLDREIRSAIQEIYRPPGYTIETPDDDSSFEWFKRLLVPMILLVYAVLAVTFESMTMPLLVLVSLPLTVLGAIWALILSGTTLGPMALFGVVALIGLTINPAILLVDRMQARARAGRTAGSCALAAVRERARPVLMTASTTIAGLWPLALVTGRENEIWPPFATVVMGGLATSTLLTLMLIPIGFVFLHRLDRIFGRLGPWIVIGWAGATTAVMWPLVAGNAISSLTWQILTTILVAAVLLGGAVLVFRRPEFPEPDRTGGPPVVDVRSLYKTYGRPGPIARAWQSVDRFADRVLAQGGTIADSVAARGSAVAWLLTAAAATYLALFFESVFWKGLFLFLAAGLAASLLLAVRRARGVVDERGKPMPGGPEGWLAAALPWVALGYLVWTTILSPRWNDEDPRLRWWVPITIAVLLAFVQFGRRTARLLSGGKIGPVPLAGRLRGTRKWWRAVCRALFGFDLRRQEVHALRGVNFRAEKGMIGILGPNGAGKTTLLRNLSGILDPSVGVVALGNVPVHRLRKYLARWVGYLPQEFGLPADMTAREYLDYYALLYEVNPAERRERVERLLSEVGLDERAGEKIGGYSGGMRQRVAVARTLLRLPEVIIVDEPTVGLDPRERIRFRNLLARLAEGRVVLFSTHVVEDVEVACERVLVFANGRMVFDGKPDDLSREAEGKVWLASLTAEEVAALPEGARVIDEVPEVSGAVRCRILCREQPHERATAEIPGLQDGYLWLVRPRRRDAA